MTASTSTTSGAVRHHFFGTGITSLAFASLLWHHGSSLAMAFDDWGILSPWIGTPWLGGRLHGHLVLWDDWTDTLYWETVADTLSCEITARTSCLGKQLHGHLVLGDGCTDTLRDSCGHLVLGTAARTPCLGNSCTNTLSWGTAADTLSWETTARTPCLGGQLRTPCLGGQLHKHHVLDSCRHLVLGTASTPTTFDAVGFISWHQRRYPRNGTWWWVYPVIGGRTSRLGTAARIPWLGQRALQQHLVTCTSTYWHWGCSNLVRHYNERHHLMAAWSRWHFEQRPLPMTFDALPITRQHHYNDSWNNPLQRQLKQRVADTWWVCASPDHCEHLVLDITIIVERVDLRVQQGQVSTAHHDAAVIANTITLIGDSEYLVRVFVVYHQDLGAKHHICPPTDALNQLPYAEMAFPKRSNRVHHRLGLAMSQNVFQAAVRSRWKDRNCRDEVSGSFHERRSWRRRRSFGLWN